MAKLTYRVTAACTGCGGCLLTCPEHAIRPGVDAPLVIIDTRCSRCGECVEVCPADAVVG